VILNRLARGDIAKPVSILISKLGKPDGLICRQLTAGDLRPHHEIPAILRFLAIDAVPFEPVEILLDDRRETQLRVAVDIMNDVKTILLELEFFLRGELDQSAFDRIKVRVNIRHRSTDSICRGGRPFPMYFLRRGQNADPLPAMLESK
jgi:hypothetical protein